MTQSHTERSLHVKKSSMGSGSNTEKVSHLSEKSSLDGWLVMLIICWTSVCMCVWASVWGDDDSWHWPIGSPFWTLFNALTDTHKHLVVAEHTFRAHTDCSRSLVCEFGCHQGRVQLVWQQDIDSWTILMFASLLYGLTHTHTLQKFFKVVRTNLALQ